MTPPRFAPPLIALLFWTAATPLAAQPAAPATPPAAAASAPLRVEIIGGRPADTEERRRSTAAKIVIGREQIDQYGDATIGEVLRRLPGVSTGGRPGRGGPPRMRGLGGGYTQLLIDGEPVPRGFSMESLTPEQVERIEILRAPTAETGARAIAGTINIITREGYRRRLNELRFGASYENGLWTPGLHWTHNDSAGALTYTLSGSAFRNWRASSQVTDTRSEDLGTGAVVQDQSQALATNERRRGVNLSTRLQWRLGEGGDMLMLMPSVFHLENDSARRYALTQSAPAAAPLYDSAATDGQGRFTVARLNGQWRQRLGESWRAEASGFASHWRALSSSLRQEFGSPASAPLRTLADDSSSRETTLKLGGKLTALLGGSTAVRDSEHNLVTGAELEALRRTESRTLLQDGIALLTSFGDNLQAESTRLAAYAQNEWTISPNWSAHAGLRWEGIETIGDPGDGSRPRNRSAVWTPLLHAVWKPDPKGSDQVRFSLTRSYRSPALTALIARPGINARFPVSGPNEATHPDRAGNPDLRPELASGVDVAIERYLPGGGILSANLFVRRISDLMRSVIALENVPWSTTPRWVSRQQNIGDAVTAGLELEAKARLDQIVAEAPRIDLRSNLALHASRVDAVPGPDNRLAEQPRATANLGADYRWGGVPLMVGGNVNWVPGYRTQLDIDQAATVSTRRVIDAYALWTINPATALRLTASNLAPGDSLETRTVVVGNLRETASTLAPSAVNWQLRLELKL